MPSKEQKERPVHNDGVALEMGQRLSHWLRQLYPRDCAKTVAREFDASPYTVKRWLAGSLPENKTLAKMARRWGKRFVSFVYEPAVGPWRSYALDEELRDLKDRLARLEEDLDDTRADAGRDSPVLPAAAHPPRPLARDPGREMAGAPAALDGGER